MRNDVITMAHGSGGLDTAELMRDVFSKHFGNEVLARLEDSAVISLVDDFPAGAAEPSACALDRAAEPSACALDRTPEPSACAPDRAPEPSACAPDRAPEPSACALDAPSRIAISTDSFVVTPLVFPGGDIGKLAACGTVNDVLMSGAAPKYLACGFIIEIGLPVSLLDDICASLAATAREAGVTIVAGDTKVIEGRAEGGGLMINTTGIGVFPSPSATLPSPSAAQPFSPGAFPSTSTALPSPSGIRPGDAIIVSGNLGDHHAAILSARMGIRNSIASDCALLSPIIDALREAGVSVHAMRDVTRGGLGTVLNELAVASGVSITLEEESIPASPAVRAFCGIMGLDPLYMGNEGKLVMAVSPGDLERALAAVRSTRIGRDAAFIGTAMPTAKPAQETFAGMAMPTAKPAQETFAGTAMPTAKPAQETFAGTAMPTAKPAQETLVGGSVSGDGSPSGENNPSGEGGAPGKARLPGTGIAPVTMRTRVGGTVRIDVLYGEGLPRIC